MVEQTVGLVVVSHSRRLAEAAVALASEMLNGHPVRLAVAAGLDETTFGTDAVRIKQAIEEVDGPAGVVVLMDLGSAVLSAELALDLLDDPSGRDRVVLSPAPLVEGLVVATVAAAGGAKRHEVAAEARDALLAKASQLGAALEEATPPVVEATSEAAGSFVVSNEHGLHARPAARLVAEVRGLDAQVLLRNRSTGVGPVPAASLSRVATLGALQGQTVEVTASGREAHEAVRRLVALAGQRFGEESGAGGTNGKDGKGGKGGADGADGAAGTDGADAPVPAGRLTTGPLPASSGVAVGPARHLTVQALPDSETAEVQAPQAEWRRVAAALDAARRRTERLRARTRLEVGPAQAAIFDAHLALLDDEALVDDVRRRVDAGAGAVAGWAAAISAVEAAWAALPDGYLRARAADVRAVGDEVLRELVGVGAATVTGPGIVVATDLTPAETAGFDARVSGIVLAHGAATSHAAILARSRGIPAVVSAGTEVLSVAEGTVLAVDGSTGELVIDPTPDVVAEFEQRSLRLVAARARDAAEAARPAVTRDGVAIPVGANVASVADARAAAAAGADDAGLVRTEFLFLGRDTAPSVDEQLADYRGISEALGGRRITLRTLDVGGDKPLPYLPSPAEDNPFLGLRGIRLSLQDKTLLSEQLQAVCRTAQQGPVDVMFPMVSQVAELLEATERLHEAAGPDGLPRGLRIGIMVEVPAAALNAAAFVPYVDFFSIGTNDLTQYGLAAERGNPHVAGLSDVLDPGVLRLVEATCRAAGDTVEVSVCGEAAADLEAVPVLLGLGVRHLSVAPVAVPQVKAAVRSLDLAQCATLAAQALSLPDSTAVRLLARTSVWSTT